MSDYQREVVNSPEETLGYGIKLGERAQLGDLFCLSGNLASGKTTLVKGIVEGALKIDRSLVVSPTFVYLNVYRSQEREKTLFHFDLYRLKSTEDFIRSGFEEYLDYPKAIICIEWSERIASLLERKRIAVHMEVLESEKRKIEIRRWDN